MKKMNRKDFLKTTLRTALFSSLLAAGLHLFTRKPAAGKQGELCINRFLCRDCGQLKSCYLPQAQSFKTVTGWSKV